MEKEVGEAKSTEAMLFSSSAEPPFLFSSAPRGRDERRLESSREETYDARSSPSFLPIPSSFSFPYLPLSPYVQSAGEAKRGRKANAGRPTARPFSSLSSSPLPVRVRVSLETRLKKAAAIRPASIPLLPLTRHWSRRRGTLFPSLLSILPCSSQSNGAMKSEEGGRLLLSLHSSSFSLHDTVNARGSNG